MEWVTQAQFAKIQGVSRMAVCKAIAAGRLRTNGKTGRDCRIDASCSLSATRSATPVNIKKSAEPVLSDEAVQAMSVWQAAKVRKLSVDIETAKFKNAELYKAMLREVSDKQLELFVTHFAPVKEALVKLRLTKKQLTDLQKIFKGALDGYKRAVREWNEAL